MHSIFQYTLPEVIFRIIPIKAREGCGRSFLPEGAENQKTNDKMSALERKQTI